MSNEFKKLANKGRKNLSCEERTKFMSEYLRIVKIHRNDATIEEIEFMDIIFPSIFQYEMYVAQCVGG